MEVLLHANLLLASDAQELDSQVQNQQCDEIDLKLTRHILNGEANVVIQELLTSNSRAAFPDSKDEVLPRLKQYVMEKLVSNPNRCLLLAIALLQLFLQNNFTGPAVFIELEKLIFEDHSAEWNLNETLIKSLSVQGQPAYILMDSPMALVFAIVLLDALTDRPSTFDPSSVDAPILDFTTQEVASLLAIAHWWRARALLVQQSLLPEPAGHQPTEASSIFSSINLAIYASKELPSFITDEFKKKLYTIFYLEQVKCSLAINTEHLCLPSLTKAKKLTEFQFVLTGARAKRTKFQQSAHSGLIILAESKNFLPNESENQDGPENMVLDSDLLLEKPHFESLGSEPLDDQIMKKQKLDHSEGIDEDLILPLAIRQEYIPKQLQLLDPNDQPTLSDYDNIQLLLRLYTIRQTTPAKDPLVEEELSALVGRILYQSGAKNWTIFSRSLWERSIIETTKAKTIERGLLQMQSLVEELGLQISARMLPQISESKATPSAQRLKYIHQLPFMPRWSLDAALAEKYMSVGVLRSAVEIYERLQMSSEAALCYAAVGDEKQAEEILLKRIEEHPTDARAFSILGDIRQDPNLWLKSWEIGKYVNAKNSLARYFYNPPKDSGLERDYGAVLKHLNDSLRQYTLSFDTWYFYGCVALECGKMKVASEAFSRCVSLDETHALAWSNLSASYVEQDKLKEAFSCLKRATASDSQKNWRIWENYMLVAVKLNEWNDVLMACKQLVTINKNNNGEQSIDLPIVEKLVELLVSTDYNTDEEQTFTYFQKTCTDFICNILPSVITTSSRCWRLVAKVEIWRKRPWAALECYEKAFRATSHNPNLETDEAVWNDSISACEDLLAAYESLGQMEGKFGEGSMVCKDWKYKARSTVKALMSKGKNMWSDSEGWEKLVELRSEL